MKKKVLLLFWASFVVSSGIPQKHRKEDIFGTGKIMSIAEINKGRDDILRPLNNPQNSAVVSKERLWKFPVSYTFGGNLGLNTKGVVLRALDQFRLKSCVDFKPLDNAKDYIKVIKGQGCWSEVGKGTNNEQLLSLGDNCDASFIAEHEFLHALGFEHEHARFDRDDYVTINFTNVEKGWEQNFQKVPKNLFTSQGTQYDYWSVMHYGQYVFSNGNGPTIIPKDLKYTDIIGQTFGMSATDVLELNLLYKCESSNAFQLHCDFSHEKACPVTTCSNNPLKWEKVLKVVGGPSFDHTSLPSGNRKAPEVRNEESFFMHVSTAKGQKGDLARLETKRVTPKRACVIKCLQFYYYHSQSQSNVLNVWIREFENEKDFHGKRRLIEKIYGPQTTHWQIKYVPLRTSKSFQIEFEVQKGDVPSRGGISIDDINLSELQCPYTTLQINNFQEIFLNTVERDYTFFSPIQYSYSGYAYSLGVYMNNPFIGVFINLVSGKYDYDLDWPVRDHQVTVQMVDQSPNIQSRMSFERSITSDFTRVNGNGTYRWGKPEDHGTYFVDEFNETIYYSPDIGLMSFKGLKELQKKSFLKGGSVVFNVFFEDVSPLNYIDELPCPPEYPEKYDENDQGPCSPKTTAKPPQTTEGKRTTHSHKPTKDKSVFGFAPNKMSSPVLIFFALLMLFMQ